MKRKLIWDELNQFHIARHQVSEEEVELANQDPAALILNTYGGRFAVIGKVKNKLLTIVLAKSGDSYYVVTARPVSRKEREVYDKKN